LAVLAVILPAGIATLKLGSKLPLMVFEQPKRLRVFEQPKRPLEQVERVLVAGDEMPVRLKLSDHRPLLGDYSTCPRYMSDRIGHGSQDTSFPAADHLFNGSGRSAMLAAMRAPPCVFVTTQRHLAGGETRIRYPNHFEAICR
jgi:hypothetical protein